MARTTTLMMGRNYTLRTTRGHVIHFEKMVPKEVPKEVEEDAMRFGAFPADPEGKAVEQEAAEKASQPSEPTEPRRERLREAIKAMHEENNRNDWTANGRPDLKALAKRAQVEDLQGKERDEVHDELKAEGVLG